MPIVVDPDGGTVATLLAALPSTAQPSAHGVASGDRLLRWLDEHPTEYVVVVGDWDCDRLPTPAVLRPSSGTVAVFDGVAGALGRVL